MKKKNLVSIIMNCHNGDKYLKEALNSVILQSYKRWELIFYDNNSTDKSAKILKSYRDKRIKYYKSNFVNLGIARKKAFMLCTGDYVTFLDCDDFWVKDKLKHQLKEMIKDKHIGLCFSNSVFFKNNFRRKLYNYVPKDGYIFSDLLKKYYISFDTVFIKMKFIKQLNSNFDKRLTIIHDLDLIIRLSQISKFKFVNKALSYWRIHENSFSKNKISRINFEKKIFKQKLKQIVKNNPNRKEFLKLFDQNLKETQVEEYFYKRKVFKILSIIKNNEFRSLKNLSMFILLFLPFGLTFYKFLKKS